tara:strand:- start:37814 stop:38638 length:825 start_codon:yes stop_codon:yes gene_type:complete
MEEETTTTTEETTIEPLAPLVGEDLTFAEGWQERVGEHAEGSTFKNLSDVLKSNKEGQRTITELHQTKADLTKQLEGLGETKVELPADAAAFKELLQLPEVPEGVQLSPEIVDSAIEFSMEKGYGPEALADFLAFDVKRAASGFEAEKTAEFTRIEGAKKAISDVVGASNYDAAIGDAQHVAQALNLPIDANDLVNQPNMVVSLAKLKTAISEGTLKGASVGGVEITSGGKLSQAKDIISNPDNQWYKAFHDNSDPNYDDAHAEHARLITESAG